MNVSRATADLCDTHPDARYTPANPYSRPMGGGARSVGP